MNARTSRLLVRIAHLHHLRDPRTPKQPVESVLADLKTAWNKTPAGERGAMRHTLVRVGHQLMEIPRG